MRRPVILAVLIAIAVRALIVAKLPAPPVWDGAIYARLAEHLANGHGYTDSSSAGQPFVPTAFYPVGYPALLATVCYLFGTGPASAAHAVNLAAAAVAAGCAAALGHRIASVRGGYLAGLGYALAPGPALWTSATMPETVTGALLVGATAAAIVPAADLRMRTAWSSLAGVLIGLAALVRTQIILSAPFTGALPPASRRTRIVAGIACTAVALLCVSPWTVRNCTTIGSCTVVSTNGGPDLLAGTFTNAHDSYGEPAATDGCAHVPNEPARDRCMTAVARSRIVQHPLKWLHLGALKLAKTFAYEWAPVNYLRSAIPGAFVGTSAVRAAAICSAWWWAAMICAAVGGRRAVRMGGQHTRALARIVTLDVILWALMHAIFLGNDRYHLALLPLLTPLAAGALLPPRPEPEPELVWAG